MRKVTAVVLALGLMSGIVAGCGVPTGNSVNNKIQTHSQTLDSKNYQSEATMTVQMDNNVQKYYVKVSYESPDMYKIELGNAEKQINQIIVHNQNGMFIVSPSLGKVFRFNGNWAENQGQIYLYDQLLKQITTGKDVKMKRANGTYSFNIPVTPATDTISTEQVVLNTSDLNPKSVTLLDKEGKAAVTLSYDSFKTGVSFGKNEFDAQSLIANAPAKTTMATDQTLGYIEPPSMFGTKMKSMMQPSDSSALLRFDGDHHYLLQESLVTPGDSGEPNAHLVDMFGVPAMYSDGGHVGSLTWIKSGVEFALTSNDLTLDQLQQIAISTFGQVGK